MYPLGLIGISQKKEEQFNSKKIWSIEDLVSYAPSKYYDFRNTVNVRDLDIGMICAVRAKILEMYCGNPSTALVQDAFGDRMKISWFGQDYIFKQLRVGETYNFCGKIASFYYYYQMVNPMLVDITNTCNRIYPVYTKINGMSNDYLIDAIKKSLLYMQIHYKADEKDVFAKSFGLCGYIEALEEFHNPTGRDEFIAARRRLVFEKIYEFYYELNRKNRNALAANITPISKFSEAKSFIGSLPFSLTAGQYTAVKSIINSMKAGNKLEALVSGDVGSGKTMVAIISALMMQENGFQSIVAAPTQILATQHYESFCDFLKNCNVNIALLTGNTKKSERNAIIQGMLSGDIDILIGTHAVLSSDIQCKNLGLTIVDEEHKFGVLQKEALISGDKSTAHHLSMTATPIPRSISNALFGSKTTILPINTMPANRKPIITTHVRTASDAFDKIREQIDMGYQAYVVCPFITDSDNEKFQNVISVESAEKKLLEYMHINPGFKPHYATINGKMKSEEIDSILADFKDGNIDILISTTIVEVGVNVPNASVIAIFSAERFGLAALHQLRGRVGRSSIQSYCELISDVEKESLDVLEAEHDGFIIAEKDLNLRGSGNILGIEQSGHYEAIDLIIKHQKLAAVIKNWVEAH